MTSAKKTFFKILGGRSDANLTFADLIALLGNLGFDLRTKGSHHIFSKDGVREILNLQPKGGMAKPYQVKQVRNVILRYKLGDYDDA
jgi:predicted RNA binding protein YcfA (HicA-like mRNA interferase family)